MLPPLLLLLFIIVPLVELALILQVGQLIGAWWTIGLLIFDSLAGAVLLRVQGRSTWRRFAAAMRKGRPPAQEVLDGALVIVGGALLLTPGFLTDGVGVLLLVPVTRAILRRTVARQVMQRMLASMTAQRRPQPTHPYDVDGRATDAGPEERRHDVRPPGEW